MSAYKEKGWDEKSVTVYIDDMITQFAKTDLVISRAGATTCAELSAAGKAAILVPLPTAADDHQRNNAEALEKNGGARMILQADLNGESLSTTISEFVGNPDVITEMELKAKMLGKPNASKETVDLIEELAGA